MLSKMNRTKLKKELVDPVKKDVTALTSCKKHMLFGFSAVFKRLSFPLLRNRTKKARGMTDTEDIKVPLNDTEKAANGQGHSHTNGDGSGSVGSAKLESAKSYVVEPEVDGLGKNQRLQLKWENLTYKVKVALNKNEVVRLS